MSTWNAINVELEEDASPDLDDTKEIQLEEAFKLYQNALRIHALGPSNYHEAESAYDELFRSEVFRYPEAVPEFEQDQADEVSPALTTPIDITVVPVTVAGASDNANSLTQLVYLAYKNRAQFEIDFAHATYERLAVSDRQGVNKHYNRACRQSLINSAIALEQDDTDLDLWKRASRVSGVLQTLRLVRFCLESVLAADDEGEDAIDLSGLEEAFANGELQSTLDTLGDNLSRLRTSNLRPKSSLLALLKQSNDPYPFLPTKSTALEYIDDKNRPLSLVYTETRLVVESATHLAVGQTLLRELSAQDSGDSQRSLGAIVKFEMPQAVEQRDVDMTANPPDLLTTEEKEVRGDSVHVVSNGELDSPASFHSVQERTEAAGQSLEDEMVQPNGEVDADIRGESETAKTAEADTDLSVLVSRKRSSTTAGNEEPEARTKSKRIKARESMIGTTAQEEEVSLDPSSISRDQALNIEAADDSLFALVNGVLDKVGVGDLGSIGSLRQQVLNNADEYYSTHLTDSDVLDGVLPATSDLRCALKGWGDDRTLPSLLAMVVAIMWKNQRGFRCS